MNIIRFRHALGATLALAAVLLLDAPAARAQSHSRATVQQGTGPGEVRRDPIEVIQATQPATLPPLPPGITLDDIRAGDEIFHGRGGCADCHGANGEGKPNDGAALTAGLHYASDRIADIETLVSCGLAPATTRVSGGMPPGGDEHHMSGVDAQRVAAYVWAISHVRDEPWPGGHARHQEKKDEGEKGKGEEDKGDEKGRSRAPVAVTRAVTAPGCPVGTALTSRGSGARDDAGKH